MKIAEKEIEIGLAQGCQYRKKAHKEIEKIDKEIEKYLNIIEQLKKDRFEKLEFDNKLANEGFCLIDKVKITHNLLTGQAMKNEMIHQNDCISKGEKL